MAGEGDAEVSVDECVIVAAPGSMVAEIIGDARVQAAWEGKLELSDDELLKDES
jgi:hypothetical protein